MPRNQGEGALEQRPAWRARRGVDGYAGGVHRRWMGGKIKDLGGRQVEGKWSVGEPERLHGQSGRG